jgi:hypothetical protein
MYEFTLFYNNVTSVTVFETKLVEIALAIFYNGWRFLLIDLTKRVIIQK